MGLTVKDFAKTLKIKDDALLERMKAAGLSHSKASDEITPADITIEEEKEVRKISLDIYKKLNLKGFSRCDFILRNNLFYFLEVNTNPGLTEESILPQQAIAANISLKDLFRSVIDKYE